MKDVLRAFGLSADTKLFSIKQGLINTTFRATDSEHDILLQKINHHVFKNPLALQNNYHRIYDHLSKKKDAFKLPSIVRTTDNQLLFEDEESNYWRAFRFVANSFTYESISDKSQAFIVAECYGMFSAQLIDLPFSTIEPTITSFHDLTFRFEQFKDALDRANEANRNSASQEIKLILNYDFITEFYKRIVSRPHLFRQYILHHDCKISNILFAKESKEVISPIDLDTTMPGYFFSDLGDMIRSVGNNLAEDDPALNKMKIKADVIESLIEGYSSATSHHFTEEENKWLPFSGHILAYMQAMRFLTDYLNGNIYYQINYSLHNLNRAKNQLKYFQVLTDWKSWPVH